MKLSNPSDNELNEVFAEKVAGWTHVHLGGDCYIWKHPRPSDGELSIYPLEEFTRSADAVLPFLEKYGVTHYFTQERGHIFMLYRDGFEHGAKCTICAGYYMEPSPKTTFARAAVIALLRSHGVELEFTA